MHLIHNIQGHLLLYITIIVAAIFLFVKIKKSIHRLIGTLIGIYSIVRVVMMFKGGF